MKEAMALFQNPMNQCCDSPTGACLSSIWHLFPALTTNIIVTAGGYESSNNAFYTTVWVCCRILPSGGLTQSWGLPCHVQAGLLLWNVLLPEAKECYASFIVVGNEWCSNFGIYFDIAPDDWISKNFIEFQISSIHRVYLPLSVDHVFAKDFSMLASSCSFYEKVWCHCCNESV